MKHRKYSAMKSGIIFIVVLLLAMTVAGCGTGKKEAQKKGEAVTQASSQGTESIMAMQEETEAATESSTEEQ